MRFGIVQCTFAYLNSLRFIQHYWCAMPENHENIRLDKWLWAARFFKTRSSAAKAVQGGKVHLNGARVKSSRAVRVGDKLDITRSEISFTIHVCGLSRFRRPAKEASLLYEETADSLKEREELREMKRMLRASDNPPPKRPDKRERRKIRDFIRKT
jgi:ribosome-associated heat shock protein Hsp15